MVGVEPPTERARAVFSEAFPSRGGASLVAVAPGRVNLVGGHTDYNDGFVLPAAVDRFVAVAATPRTDSTIEVYSETVDERATISLGHDDEETIGSVSVGDGDFGSLPRWAEYVRGVAMSALDRGWRVGGATLAIVSTVPMGAGLSSSAALEAAVGRALAALIDLDPPPEELATVCHTAEREFVGVQCGIMDQFSSVYGRPGEAMLIDCRELTVEHVPLPADQVRLVVVDTNVSHELADSKYNDRVRECERATELLATVLDRAVETLRDVSLEELQSVAGQLPQPARDRARHVVRENERVQEAAGALRAGEFSRVGELMVTSHESLRDQYAVSCEELDLVVSIATDVDGVYGARMTGAGFGGSVVALAEPGAVDRFEHTVGERYRRETGLEADVHVLTPAAGCYLA